MAKAITNEEKGLKNFGIDKKIQKIMNEQQKKNTRKQSQREKEKDELIAREHKTKKWYEQSGASIAIQPVKEKSIP